MSHAAAPRAIDAGQRRSLGVWAGVTLVVLAVAYAPLLWKFFAQQWQREHYQHYPFVLAAFAWLLWSRLGYADPRTDGSDRRRRVVGGACLVAAWVLLALAYLSDSPWAAATSAAALAAWGFLQISRRWVVPCLWGIWLFLWLVIPPPLNRDQKLISFLQQKSSQASSFALDWLGVRHLMEGNTLILPNKQFFVDEACSGIISVLSIIACALIYGVWRNRPPFHLGLLIVAGIAWATIMNVLRIVTIALVFDRFAIDWSSGTPHEILSLVIFTLSFLALVSTDLALVAVSAPITAELQTQSAVLPKFGGGLIRLWDWAVSWGRPDLEDDDEPAIDSAGRVAILGRALAMPIMALSVFAVLVVAQWGAAAYYSGAGARGPEMLVGGSQLGDAAIARGLALEADDVPARIGALRRVEFEKQERERDSIYGAYSRAFKFQGRQAAQHLISCDFPFGSTWHDLTVCYTGMGWEIVRQRIVAPERQEAAVEGDEPWEYLEIEMKKPDGMVGFLAYSCFDGAGERVDPPTGSIWRDSLTSLFKKYQPQRADQLFQVQSFTTGEGAVSQQERDAAVSLLLSMRERLRQRVSAARSAESVAPAADASDSSAESPADPSDANAAQAN